MNQFKRMIVLLLVFTLMTPAVFAAEERTPEIVEYDLAYMPASVSAGATLSDKMFKKTNATREFLATAAKQYIEYSIDFPAAGCWQIFLTAYVSSMFSVEIDGQPVGGVFDGKAAWKEYRVGSVVTSGRETKNFRLISNQAGKALYFSHITAKRNNVYYYDAGMLNKTASISDNSKSSKIFGQQDYYQAITYRPDASLTATSNNTVMGKYLEFTVDMPVSGKYEMMLGYKGGASGAGIYNIVVNGEEAERDIDPYTAVLDNYMSCGTYVLKKGTNTIRMVCKGKNSSGTGFQCTINGIGFALLEELMVTEAEPTREMRMLEGLGIMEPDRVSASDFVTRAEFAKILAALTNNKRTNDQIVQFTDVPTSSKDYPFVNFAVTMGYMQSTDGAFYPTQPLSLEAASYALAAVLGYGDVAKQNGALWFTASARLLHNITVSDNRALTYANVGGLIYNALHIGMADSIYTVANGDVYTWTDAGTETILSKYLLLEQGSGIITQNEYTALEDTNGTDGKSVLINKVEYPIGKTDIDRYLGYHVAFWYDKETKVIQFFEAKNTEVVKVDAADVGGIENDRFLYYDTNTKRTRTLPLDSGICLIFNGKANPAFQNEDLAFNNGWLELIDNNCDGEVDVIHAVSYENDVVVSVYPGMFVINGKKGGIAVDEKANDVVYIENGMPSSIEKITNGMVISVAKSKNTTGKKLITIYVSTQRVSGVVGSTDSESVYMDGVQYFLAGAYPIPNTLKIGAACVAYLDVSGKIAYMDTSGAGAHQMFGYLVKAGMHGGLNHTIVLKIFDENGVMALYDVDENIRINGVSAGNSAFGAKWSPIYDRAANTAIPQLITFSINAKDKIGSITTASENENAVLRYASDRAYDQKSVTYIYRSSPRYLVAQPTTTYTCGFVAGAETKIFVVPENLQDDQSYYIADYTMLQGDASYALKAYNVNRLRVPELLLIEDKGAVHDKDAFGIVSQTSMADVNGSSVYGVSIISAKKEIVLYANPDSDSLAETIATLKKGDVVRFRQHPNKLQLERIKLVVSLSSPSLDYAKINPSTAYAYGVSKVQDLMNGIAVVNTPDSTSTALDATVINIENARNIAVLENGKVRIGSPSDVTAGDDVYCRLSYGAPLDFFIIKK